MLQAIAVIRQKPEGTSAHDFALSLAECFKKGELSWRGRARQLESQLLQTRQELLQVRLQAAAIRITGKVDKKHGT